jgi:hypothetical protein
MSYATAIRSSRASSGSDGFDEQTMNDKPPATTSKQDNANRKKRSPSPHQRPKTEDENVYILTLQTDPAHHQRMTTLRSKYFPPKLNRTEAHLTLFHALPESRLQSHILPTIESVAAERKPFSITASSVAKLGKRGVGIFIPDGSGGREAKAVHRELQSPWKTAGFLSQQDEAPMRLHYTVMNKVDDESEVRRVVEELRERVENEGGDEGTVEGLGLWLYERGYWRWVRGWQFNGRAKR